MALDEEQTLWQNRDTDHAALDLMNYQLEEGEPADGLLTIQTKPRRRDVLLFEGSIFVKPDADTVRIEGRLSKAPSFWTRQVEITRRYDRVAGARMPVEFESVARVLIAGRSTLRMAYDYESVNNTRVGAPEPRTQRTPPDNDHCVLTRSAIVPVLSNNSIEVSGGTCVVKRYRAGCSAPCAYRKARSEIYRHTIQSVQRCHECISRLVEEVEYGIAAIIIGVERSDYIARTSRRSSIRVAISGSPRLPG